MTDLEKLKELIDEANYPYFEDDELQGLIDEGIDLYVIARELCLIKAGIEEMKLGDVIIPSPRNHFLMLAKKYRQNLTGVVARGDE